MVRISSFHATLEAWKSIEWPSLFLGSLTRVMVNRSPTRPRTAGPGTLPLKLHICCLTPGATSTTLSVAVIVSLCSRPPGAGSSLALSSRGASVCSAAAAGAVPPTRTWKVMPASLWPGIEHSPVIALVTVPRSRVALAPVLRSGVFGPPWIVRLWGTAPSFTTFSVTGVPAGTSTTLGTTAISLSTILNVCGEPSGSWVAAAGAGAPAVSRLPTRPRTWPSSTIITNNARTSTPTTKRSTICSNVKVGLSSLLPADLSEAAMALPPVVHRSAMTAHGSSRRPPPPGSAPPTRAGRAEGPPTGGPLRPALLLASASLPSVRLDLGPARRGRVPAEPAGQGTQHVVAGEDADGPAVAVDHRDPVGAGLLHGHHHPGQRPVGACRERLAGHQLVHAVPGKVVLVPQERPGRLDVGPGRQRRRKQVAEGDHADHPAAVDDRRAGHGRLRQPVRGHVGGRVRRQRQHLAGHRLLDRSQQGCQARLVVQGRSHRGRLLDRRASEESPPTRASVISAPAAPAIGPGAAGTTGPARARARTPPQRGPRRPPVVRTVRCAWSAAR